LWLATGVALLAGVALIVALGGLNEADSGAALAAYRSGDTARWLASASASWPG
jgi:hypothetical protein